VKCKTCKQEIPEQDWPFIIAAGQPACRFCMKMMWWIGKNILFYSVVKHYNRVESHFLNSEIQVNRVGRYSKDNEEEGFKCGFCGIEDELGGVISHVVSMHSGIIDKIVIHYPAKKGFGDWKLCNEHDGILVDERWMCDCKVCLSKMEE